MFEGRMNRRTVMGLATLALLAGCQVIPKGAPQPQPTPTGPSEELPTDKQRHRIALLVPLSGPNGALGQSFANATTMALLDTNAQNIRITTYDTAGGPAAAATKAVQEGARLILGPLQSGDVAPVAAVARAAKIPLISYVGDANLAARDVFVMGTAPGNSIERTVQFAARQGLKRFAMLAPNGDYGARARGAFAAAVAASGGTVTTTLGYDRSNTSIISAAQRLKAKGGFDAVLIADGARMAVMAAPQFKTAAAGPRLLGTELWSGEIQLTKTAALRGAWFAAISDSRFARFADSYKTRFSAAPFRASTLGYDSVLLTVRIAREWKVGTPFPTARLADTGGFLGLDGPFRFSADGVIERALEVREVRTGTFAVVGPAPDKFTD